MRQGLALTVEFFLDGVCLIGLNGGPIFLLTPAVSIAILCDTQEKLDQPWDALIAEGGQEGQSVWLEDCFGMSWQIMPRQLAPWFAMPGAADQMMSACVSMGNLNIARLEAALCG
jgi:predicted 3-demethylubiquinone-9 3-methyltransferase (glyoxalase superfamily)